MGGKDATRSWSASIGVLLLDVDGFFLEESKFRSICICSFVSFAFGLLDLFLKSIYLLDEISFEKFCVILTPLNCLRRLAAP